METEGLGLVSEPCAPCNRFSLIKCQRGRGQRFTSTIWLFHFRAQLRGATFNFLSREAGLPGNLSVWRMQVSGDPALAVIEHSPWHSLQWS
jgi:hypothetical protein